MSGKNRGYHGKHHDHHGRAQDMNGTWSPGPGDAGEAGLQPYSPGGRPQSGFATGFILIHPDSPHRKVASG